MEQEQENYEELKPGAEEPFAQLEFNIPQTEPEPPILEPAPPTLEPEPVAIEPVVETEPKIPDYRRPLWAVLIITLWIAGLYGAFYYFLVSHRYVSYIIGG